MAADRCLPFLRSAFGFACLLAGLLPARTLAQSAFLPLSRQVEAEYEHRLNRPGNNLHTSFKPWLTRDVADAYAVTDDSISSTALSLYESGRICDSIAIAPVIPGSRFSRTLVGRKLLREHLLQVQEKDVHLYVDPLLEFAGGQDRANNRNLINNTRGVRINGSVGKRFGFNATFYENVGRFPRYLDSVVNITRVVPGQGRVKSFGDGAYDYAFTTGTIHYQLNRHFTFEFGQDRNFIGDGYRSLLLSDNAFHYPYVKIITDIWKIRYVNLFTELRELNRPSNDNDPFIKKYASMHYFDINIGKRTTLGIYEAVIWHSDSIDGARGFDIAYMNPFIFFRPVEFSIGSPDNVLMGINLKYKLSSNHQLYGQFMLDEFLLKNVRSGNGWWANKQGIQFGFKGFDLFGVKGLYVQGELNYVRPYTYQHLDRWGTYTHYRGALAHPLGANFTETIGIARYTHRRFQVELKTTMAEVGLDTAGLNYGQNIFQSYNNYVNEFGNRVGQGLTTRINWTEVTLSYLVNPMYRMNLFAYAARRSFSNVKTNDATWIVQAGVRTSLFNRYYDF